MSYFRDLIDEQSFRHTSSVPQGNGCHCWRHTAHVPLFQSLRRYLRFFWHEDNDVDKDLKEYCIHVHVFGNKPSPAVATYGLRKIAEISKSTHGAEVSEFICRNFYVDDGLTSCPTAEEATSLLQKTQDAMKQNGNLRLHKFASNSPFVMEAFDPEDLAKGVYQLDLEDDPSNTAKSWHQLESRRRQLPLQYLDRRQTFVQKRCPINSQQPI